MRRVPVGRQNLIRSLVATWQRWPLRPRRGDVQAGLALVAALAVLYCIVAVLES